MCKCINKIWFKFKEAVFSHNLHLAFSQASPEISLALMWAMPALTLPALRRISACCPGALRPSETLRKCNKTQILRFLSKKMDSQDLFPPDEKYTKIRGVFTIFSFEGFVVCWKGPVS